MIWISVKDRFPRYSKKVKVLLKNGEAINAYFNHDRLMPFALYHKTGYWTRASSPYEIIDDLVTHWMQFTNSEEE